MFDDDLPIAHEIDGRTVQLRGFADISGSSLQRLLDAGGKTRISALRGLLHGPLSINNGARPELTYTAHECTSGL